MTKRSIEVCLTPALLHLHSLENKVVVIIDIFRATSAICYGIENGAKRIIPVSSVEECLSYEKKGYLLAAERNGKVLDGFEFGNSPLAYTSEKIKDRTIVLTTTNGTKAIAASKNAPKVAIGSFLNIDALCNWLKLQNESILLFCSGWKDRVSLEDTLFAGAVFNRLQDTYTTDCDATLLAHDAYLQAKDDIKQYLKKASHNIRLRELGIEKDIDLCLTENITTSIPILTNENTLIKA